VSEVWPDPQSTTAPVILRDAVRMLAGVGGRGGAVWSVSQAAWAVYRVDLHAVEATEDVFD
jgi:hypothetical protein